MNKKLLIGATLYTLFVVYGSLVPLDYRPMPFDVALEKFRNIRYLNLGIESRADWVANILLYIPLAYFWAAGFGGQFREYTRLLVAVPVLLFCWTLAVSVEFAQLFFPPRTVSINDLIAEAMGSAMGVGLWLFSGDYFRRLSRHLSLGNFLSIKAAIIFYIAIYFALSFFPFDFVISHQEFDTRLASGNHSLFMSIDTCRADGIRCVVKLGAEIVVLIPLGILLCLLPYISHPKLVCILTGFFIGLFVEIGQLFLASGVAQGISVLTRMTGLGVGAVVFAFFSKHDKDYWIACLKPTVLTLLPLHVFLVAALNGWTGGNWIGLEKALEKLDTVQFLPFYYFYYTTESLAMVSLLSNIGMYFPIGLAFWLWNYADSKPERVHWCLVGLSAAVFATLIETGKLFLAPKHPDPTDVLIAFASAALVYELLNHAMRWFSNGKIKQGRGLSIAEAFHDHENSISEDDPIRSSATVKPEEIDKRWRVLSGILALIIGWALLNYPIGAPLLSALLIAYGVLLFRYPHAWLFVLPAMLPVLDFAPWTGRFFFDEFDLVVMTTLAVYYWQKSSIRLTRQFSGTVKLCLGMFALIYLISLYRGLFPLQDIDINAFSNYYSYYNSLRVGKGVIWAFFLFHLLKQTLQQYPKAKQYFGYGALLGLIGVISVSIWERFLFSGLFNFESDYRITAMFSTMHTGGGHIDAYLVLALPFIAMLFLYAPRRLIGGMAGFGIFAAGLYVLMVTFSRGPYLAFAIALIVFLISLVFAVNAKHLRTNRKSIPLLSVVLLVPVMVIPVFQGGFIQERFKRIDQDLDVRLQHWQAILDMRDEDVMTTLFGMGVGSYPRTYFWWHRGIGMPATYTIQNDDGNRYLRLGAGGALYLDQQVAIEPDTKYRLSADLRTDSGQGEVTFPICEKSLLYSFRCVWSTLRINSEPGTWSRTEEILNTKYVGSSLGKTVGELSRRPVKLGVYNNSQGNVIDIDNISLIDSNNKNLLSNGDFSEGMDYWFFTIDNHQALNIDNFWVHLLFDLGWFGTTAFIILLIYACYRQLKALSKGDYYAAILLSSFSGFVVVGTVGSPFEAPRLSLLFFLIVFFALSENKKLPLRKRTPEFVKSSLS
ncbi:VanZ family protein [Methylotuvimicrobium sp.]|uniref:VanZ family protein n=1 Tax=Methylotuvimicrobium sp. TaxID=2822413 RepID=UPI003D66135A